MDEAEPTRTPPPSPPLPPPPSRAQHNAYQDCITAPNTTTVTPLPLPVPTDPPVDRVHDMSGAAMPAGVAAGVLMLALVPCLVMTFICCRSKSKRIAHKPSIDEVASARATLDSDNSSMYHLLQSMRSAAGSPTQQAVLRPRSSSLWQDPAITMARISVADLAVGPLVRHAGVYEFYAATFQDQPVQLKLLDADHRMDLRRIEDLLAECKLTLSLEHPHIVGLVGVAWTSLADIMMVAPRLAGGDLRSLLDTFELTRPRPHGFDHDKAQIALQVTQALVHVHSLTEPVLHRDLQSRHVQLDDAWNAKLSNFGVARLRAEVSMEDSADAVWWLAPEVLRGERYSDKADVFALGVVLSELDTHLAPYAHARLATGGKTNPLVDGELLQQIASGCLRVQFSVNAPRILLELATACLQVDPHARPTAAEALYKLHLMC